VQKASMERVNPRGKSATECFYEWELFRLRQRLSGLTGENVSTRWLEAIKYPRQQTSLAVSMGRTLE